MNRRDIIAMARIEESFKQREREAQQEEREYDPLEDYETVARVISLADLDPAIEVTPMG